MHFSKAPPGKLEPGDRPRLLLEDSQEFVRPLQRVIVMLAVLCPERTLHPLAKSNRPLREDVPASDLTDTDHHKRKDLKNSFPLVRRRTTGMGEEILLGRKPKTAWPVFEVHLQATLSISFEADLQGPKRTPLEPASI